MYTDSSASARAPMEEEAPELISPRISFSHDVVLAAAATSTPPYSSQTSTTIRSDTSLMIMSSRRLPEPEFDFANAAAADVAPAGRLFAGGKLLPVPPLPPTPNDGRPKPASPCKHKATNSSCAVKPPSCQKRPGSWTSSSPFTRSSSVNSSTTTTAARSAASGRFSCPSFPLMRSRSTGSATAAAAQGGIVSGAGHRPQYKKVGATAAAGSTAARSVYYYGGSRNVSSSSHGVRVSPVIHLPVPAIGTSVVNVLSYLLCDCGNKTTKNRGFRVSNC